ncbi:MAG: glycosyltransferase family 4 protein [Verrucomicrobia bacterium]|nr:glycosyltransferase family 4 protein [Verrucomicrobiota bacterium]
MKRIAYICADPGVPVFGCKGASVHVQEVIRAMHRLGATVELFAARIGGDVPNDLRHLRVHQLPTPPKGELAERERALLAANDALATALSEAGPFDLIYERYSLWSFAAMKFARARGVRSVLEVNAPLIDEQAAHRGLSDRDAAEAVAKRAFDAASVIGCVSEGVAQWVRSRIEDKSAVIEPDGRARRSARAAASVEESNPSTKVHVVPNAVNPHRFGPKVKAHQPPSGDAFVVGFVGTLKPWHGLPVLADAFIQFHAQNPAARLLIVGDGPERDALSSALAARGLSDAVHFTGAVTPEEIPGWLASMHVAVAPYPALDNFYFSPLKLFEYLAAGLPTVASRIGQVTELLREGETGLLVTPGDPTSLCSTLARLRADASLRAQLGANGRAYVERHHTWDAAVARLLKLAKN